MTERGILSVADTTGEMRNISTVGSDSEELITMVPY